MNSEILEAERRGAERERARVVALLEHQEQAWRGATFSKTGEERAATYRTAISLVVGDDILPASVAVEDERKRIEREVRLLMENNGGLVLYDKVLRVVRGESAYRKQGGGE